MAEDLLSHPDLSSGALDLLRQYRAEFLLGNTAPDVQTISGQDRKATHFFDLPIHPNVRPAWEQLLLNHPDLRYRTGSSAAQAAFLAGYLCHLQADWYWVVRIFAPVFGPQSGWQNFQRRLYLHNVLRAYLDQQILGILPAHLNTDLEQVKPSGWLPFVEDIYLERWRDFLVQQLQPGSTVQTVEVFAARQNIPPAEYYQLLGSEEQLDQEIFTHLPRQDLQAYRKHLLEENLQLLRTYLDDR